MWIIEVAKNEFRGAIAARVLRGASKKPLFVTAARDVRSMHGDYRVPTLLARADRLCRLSTT